MTTTRLRPLLPLLLGLTLLGCPGPAKTTATKTKTDAAKTEAVKTEAAKTKTVATKTETPAKTPDVAAKLPHATYFAFKG